MNNFNKIKLKETLKSCNLHHERMMFAFNRSIELFPLDQKKYDAIEPEQISFIDQLIFRYSRLQDLMGNKLFRQILESLREDISGKAFIDILNLMEKLGLLEDQEQWLSLRETRNLITHEYPFNKDDSIEGLNELSHQSMILSNIWLDLKEYCEKKFII